MTVFFLNLVCPCLCMFADMFHAYLSEGIPIDQGSICNQRRSFGPVAPKFSLGVEVESLGLSYLLFLASFFTGRKINDITG